jgi:tRNA (guanine37-N1)-methyltransferase
MRFDIITLFPDLFGPFLREGITRRAFDSGQVEVRLWPLRDHATDTYRRVDDRPYGGGPGMVMLAEPLARALAAVGADRAAAGAPPAPLVHFSPGGRRIDQALLRELSAGPGAVLLCGRYEGVDQRLLDRHGAVELSLGDFVLSGGEVPAMALLDGVARLQPGVLGDPQSPLQESFEDGLLEGPHYSRPEVWTADDGERPVPPVLLSGHHGQIARWRREQSLARTARQRPDLLAAARRQGRLSAADESYLRSIGL